MTIPAQIAFEHHWIKTRGKSSRSDLKKHPLQPQTYVSDAANRHWVTFQAALHYVAKNNNLNLDDWANIGFTDSKQCTDCGHVYMMTEGKQTMKHDEIEAFIKAYGTNVAMVDDDKVRAFLIRLDSGEDVDYSHDYTSIMDALGMWHDALAWHLSKLK